MAWSADGGTFYYIDSPTRRVDAFDYDLATGSIARRRPWLALGAATAVVLWLVLTGLLAWVAVVGDLVPTLFSLLALALYLCSVQAAVVTGTDISIVCRWDDNSLPSPSGASWAAMRKRRP